jgi:hypothetical protein
MYITIKYMMINYAHQLLITHLLLHSLHHMIIILNIHINIIIIKYTIINLYLHIAAPATVAHTYHLSIAPLSVACIACTCI